MNPLSAALKNRRSEGARPQMTAPMPGDKGPMPQGENALAEIVAALSPEQKAELLSLLQPKGETPEQEASEEHAPEMDSAGQSKVTDAELAELQAEMAGAFGGDQQMGDAPMGAGGKAPSLNDRMNFSLSKFKNKK